MHSLFATAISATDTKWVGLTPTVANKLRPEYVLQDVFIRHGEHDWRCGIVSVQTTNFEKLRRPALRPANMRSAQLPERPR